MCGESGSWYKDNDVQHFNAKLLRHRVTSPARCMHHDLDTGVLMRLAAVKGPCPVRTGMDPRLSWYVNCDM